MNRVPVADWAATAPWDGIVGKPSVFPTGPVDLSNVTWNGVPKNRYPVWNGTRFVPTALPSGSGSNDFQVINVPGAAYRKRPSGQPSGQFQNVWDRFEANVRLFGAAGDGGSDDTGAYNQAVSAVNAAGAGSVYFPSGQYRLDASSLNYLTVPSEVRGDGIGVSVLEFGGTGGLLVSIGTGSFGIRDLSVGGAPTALSVSSSHLTAMDCAFEASERGIDISEVTDGYIGGCLLSSLGTATGIYGDFSGVQVDNIRLIDAFSWQDGIRLESGEDNSFTNIYVGNAFESAVSLGTATYGNRVQNVSFKNILGSQPVLNMGTNNYVSDQFGLGGNTNTLYESRKDLIAKFSWNPPPIPVGTGYYDDFNMPGTDLGDQMGWGTPLEIEPAVRIQVQMVASDTPRISVINLGTATVDIASADWSIRAQN